MEAGRMSAETAATPAAVDSDPVADALEEFAAFRTDADAALVDARRRREAAPAEVAAWSEARRRAAEVERAARAGWADDD
jgi:L-rhamnose isomerase